MTFREPIMVQRYVPEVRKGDKRIILVDGEIAGAINRVPAADETRSNLHVGGTAKPTTLTKRDKEICARLGPELKKRGLIFAGIDVIGDYLTEINVTSPTGIRQIGAIRRTGHRRHDLGRGGEEARRAEAEEESLAPARLNHPSQFSCDRRQFGLYFGHIPAVHP